ncbi:DMT family transporter [Actinomadura atramentaria]|uniref:DMT family transporter n=1 Tax=Actinomadura atramentaria TaxID=1990 RepID=UPI0003602125|nr:DMT family transporter [Actinomadura atramentaria]
MTAVAAEPRAAAGTSPLDRLLRAAFVCVWSTGFVAGSRALTHMGPFTVNFFRFGVAAVAVTGAAVAARAAWPRTPRELVRVVVPGFLIQAVHQGAVYYGMAHGVPPGLSALIIGISPVLTGLLAAGFLAEPLRRVQVAGLAIGAAGVVTALWGRLGAASDTAAYAVTGAALCALSLGTVLQRRWQTSYDLRVVSSLQLLATVAVLGPVAWFAEGFAVRAGSAAPVVAEIAWLALVNAVGGVCIYFALLRRGTAAATGSVFYLVPPTTALLAWLALGRPVGGAVLAGLAITAAGTFAATRTVRDRTGAEHERG